MAPPGLKALTAAALLALAPLASGLGQKQIISFEHSGGALQVAGGDIGAGQIRVSEDEFWGVVRAAGDLAVDFGRVTGTNYSLSNGVESAKAVEYKFEPADVSDNTVVSDFYKLFRLNWAENGKLLVRVLRKCVRGTACPWRHLCWWLPTYTLETDQRTPALAQLILSLHPHQPR